MASSFILVLDTLAPSNVTFLIDGGNTYSSNPNRLVDLTIQTDDIETSGYQMKIWGNIDLAHDTNIQNTEELSKWASFSANKQVKLSENDGKKTLYLKLRDDVYNESSIVSRSITLDSSLPSVEITGIDTRKISKQQGKNVMSFSFMVSDNNNEEAKFVEYKVMVVSSEGSTHDTGVVIGVVNGSSNMNGNGLFPVATPINCTVNGSDLEIASSGDGEKCIKVFVKDEAGNWSV